MAVGDVYRCAFEYGVEGQTCVNVFHFKQVQSAGAGEDAKRAAEVLGTRLGELYSPILPAVTRQPRKCTTQLIARLNVDVGEFGYQFSGSVTPSGDSLPSFVAAVIRVRTGLAGRTRRGRFYLAGVPFNWESGGLLSATGNTNYSLFISTMTSEFLGEGGASSYQLGVFSRERYKVASNPLDEWWKPATQLAVVEALTSQRRRRVGVGS